MSEYVDGGEPSRGVGSAQQVVHSELGYDACMRWQAHATDRSEPHSHTITTTALLSVEI